MLTTSTERFLIDQHTSLGNTFAPINFQGSSIFIPRKAATLLPTFDWEKFKSSHPKNVSAAELLEAAWNLNQDLPCDQLKDFYQEFVKGQESWYDLDIKGMQWVSKS